MLTHLSKDPKLIETYNAGRDLYATIAAMVFKKDYWECMEHWEDGSANPDGKAIRSKAKGLVLGIMYGMGAKLMSSILDVTVDECKNILDEFYKMFPTVRDFTVGNEVSAKEKGYVEDYIGRRRHLPDINLPQVKITATRKEPVNSDLFLEDNIPLALDVYDEAESKYWLDEYEKMMGEKYSYNRKVEFKEKAAAAGVNVFDNGAFISKATTQCTNAIIQGSAATLTKKAMVEIFNDPELNKYGFRLLIPVHDELLGECPAENAEKVEQLLAAAMIRAGKPECSVNMKCDTYCVKHWYTDEVENSIHDTYLQYVNGNPKKNITPVSSEEAIEKLANKYCELNRDAVVKMCMGEFDHINGHL